MKDDADKNYLNQAMVLEDGQKIYIPTIDEMKDEPQEEMNNKGFKEDTKININNADIEELMTLSGVGESKARAIIEYREKNGNYSKIEDIMNVTGIKEAMFAKICDSITV